MESIEYQRKMGRRLLDFEKSRNEQPIFPIINNQRNTIEGSRRGKVHTTQDFLNFEDSMLLLNGLFLYLQYFDLVMS